MYLLFYIYFLLNFFNMRLEDLPSKKYNNEVKKEIHYGDIDNHIESDTFSSEYNF